ncbi:hypothetical protein GCM10017559_08390 [Streptosporangium longisporum]|uniref:Uncharacterized protein n=1 Tax=Streptosporangium longisporum TaxID=46187 RepID=A0ABN3XRR0_9ACTN
MSPLAVILLVAALIAFLLAAFGVQTPRLLAAGLACWVLADLLPALTL